MRQEKRVLIKDVLKEGYLDRDEFLAGWIYEKRKIGDKNFLVLGDRSGRIQIILPRRNGDETKKIRVGDVVRVEGRAKKDERAPGGVEILANKVEVIAPCHYPTPIPLRHLEKRKRMRPSLEKRLTYRYLDLRDGRVAFIFKLKSEVAYLLREYFRANDFIEVHTPKIVEEGAEGGAALFLVEYFAEDAFLAQSPQFYKQMLMCSGLERVYEIAPAFRAERHSTPRHLNEFISVDAEMAFIKDEEDVMNFQEDLIAFLYEKIKPFFEKNEFPPPPKPSKPFPRLTMDDAYSILREEGIEVEWGEDIPYTGLKKLSELYAEKGYTYFFLTKFPREIRPAYLMPDPDDPRVTRSFDLISNGLEISSGGQRIHEYEMLVKEYKRRGVPISRYSFYLEAFKYGMPPHGGFGMGLERLIMSILKLENIREAMLFPRDRKRLYP